MGLFSFVSGIFGGNAQKKASAYATKEQVAAAQRGIDETRRQFDVTRADYAPYLTAGTQALSGISGLIGLGGGDAQTAALDALEKSPMFQSVVRNGEEAVLQNAAATGGLRGGNTQRGLADFRSDAFLDTIRQQLSALGGVAGMGMGATDSVSGFGAQASNNVVNLLGQQGAARAGNHLLRGGVNARNWQNGGDLADSLISALAGAPNLKSGLTAFAKGF